MTESLGRAMGSTVDRCPHCGRVDWSKYPKLWSTMKRCRHREKITSRWLANECGITIQAASNRLARLAGAGYLAVVDTYYPDNGGTMHVYVWTDLLKDAMEVGP